MLLVLVSSFLLLFSPDVTHSAATESNTYTSTVSNTFVWGRQGGIRMAGVLNDIFDPMP